MNDRDQIISHIFNFIKSNPGFLKVTDPGKIFAQVEAAMRGAAPDLSVLHDYSELLIAQGVYDRAGDLLHMLIDSDPRNYRAHFLQAMCFYLRGELKEAQFPIIKCLEIQPNYDAGRFLLAKIFLKARQYEKAQKIFDYYLKTPEFSKQSEIYISKCYYYSGGFESAAAFADGLLRDSGPHPFVAMAYAYQLSNVESYDRAFSVIYDQAARSDISEIERVILNYMNVFLLSFAARGNHSDDFLNEARAVMRECENDIKWLNQDLYGVYKNFAETVYYMKTGNFNRMKTCADAVMTYKGNFSLEDFVVFDYEEFLNIYKLALNQGTRNEAERLMYLGSTHIGAGNLQSGVRYLEGASAKAPDNIDILTRLGESYSLVNQMPKALQAFARIKALAPKNIDAYRRTCEIYMSTGQYEKFISECRHILALDPADYFSRFYIGEYLYNNSNLKEAEEFLKHLADRIENQIRAAKLESLPYDVKDLYERACFILANIAIKDSQRENAIIYLNSVININPENEKAYELLNKLKQNRQDRELMFLLREAEEKEAENDLAQAMQVYENMIEINPQFIEAHYRLARNLMKQKNYDRALFELERIFEYPYERYERLNDIYMSMALISYELGKLDKCRSVLSTLTGTLKDPSAGLMLLYVYRAAFLIQGNSPEFNAFIDGLMKARLDDEENFSANFSIGYAVFNTPRWIFEDESIFAAALEAARAAYDADRRDIYALYGYAVALEKTGDIEGAYAHYNELCEITPESDAVEYTRDKYAFINGHHDLSSSLYNFNLLENLNVLSVLNAALLKMANYDESNGNLASASTNYGRAAALYPDNALAAMKHIDLHLTLALNDKTTKISKISTFIKNLKKEIAADSRRADLKFKLGYLYFKLPEDMESFGSSIENVIMELKHCISIDNKYLPAYAALRVVYQKLGAGDKKMYALAVDTMKMAFEYINPKNPYLNIEMGDCFFYFYGQDMKNDACEYYKHAIMYKPDFIEAHFKLASIYRIKKDYENSILHFGIVYDLEPNGPYAEECKKSISTLKRRHMIE